ncbi:hypothetical protein HK405_000919, partial [Cladochytrium tenue]
YARWTALAIGLWWGYSRQQSLKRYVKDRHETEEEQKYKDLVEEGKVAFEAAYNREQAAKAAKEGVAIMADSYKFDAEKWLNWATVDYEASEAKRKAAIGKK